MKLLEVFLIIASAFLVKGDPEPRAAANTLLRNNDRYQRQCYQCSGIDCNFPYHKSVLCPPDTPVCASRITSQKMRMSLTCDVPNPRTCLLVESEDSFNLTCACKGNFCNKIFTPVVVSNFRNFTSVLADFKGMSNITDIFFTNAFNTNTNNSFLYFLLTNIIPSTFSNGDIAFGKVINSSDGREVPDKLDLVRRINRTFVIGDDFFPNGYPTPTSAGAADAAAAGASRPGAHLTVTTFLYTAILVSLL